MDSKQDKQQPSVDVPSVGGSGHRHLRPKIDVSALVSAAKDHHRAQRMSEAEAGYRQALALNPDQLEARYFLGLIALQSNDPHGAAGEFEKAAAGDPENPEFHAVLGAAYMMLQRRAEGVKELKEALGLNPSHVQANYNVGSAYLEDGMLDEAQAHLERSVALAPGYADANNSLGIVFAQRDQHEAAAAQFRRALNAQPGHVHALRNLGNALVELERFDEAVAQFQELVAAQPDQPIALFHLAYAHTKAHQYTEAKAAYSKAISIDPNFVDAHNNLGSLLLRSGEALLALEHFRRSDTLRPNNPFILTNIANSLSELGQTAESASVYRKVIELGPKDVSETYVDLVRAVQYLGDFDQANELIEEFKRKEPDSLIPLCLKAVNKGEQLTDEDVQSLRAAIEQFDENNYRITIAPCFALGSYFDRKGEFDTAFEYYSRGCSLRGRDYDYDAAAFDKLVDDIEVVFDRDFIEARAKFGSPSHRPIFIVGMPRSGTTLTEQIIASHPDVEGGGELTIWADLVPGLRSKLHLEEMYPHSIKKLDGGAFKELADNYLQKLETLVSTNLRTTDKMPGNLNFLGLISMVFPNAKIIHCRRDPRDTCLSIFFQNFTGGHPYSYDLHNLGRRYRATERMMAHWKQILPGAILDVSYEETVADLAGVGRRILEFCDLKWDPGVLDFHNTDRTVKTASLWQIRQPVYTSSVERWRNYERHLEPLEKGLRGEPR